jgi:hypothetical protein
MLSKEQFEAFEVVRESGATNMWDTRTVSMLSGGVLSDDDALEVIKTYSQLCEAYPDVRSNDE